MLLGQTFKLPPPPLFTNPLERHLNLNPGKSKLNHAFQNIKTRDRTSMLPILKIFMSFCPIFDWVWPKLDPLGVSNISNMYFSVKLRDSPRCSHQPTWSSTQNANYKILSRSVRWRMKKKRSFLGSLQSDNWIGVIDLLCCPIPRN